jgi:hypothetical protein
MRTATVLFENNPFLLFATLQTAIILFATTVTTSESVYNLFSQKIPMQKKCGILQPNNIEVNWINCFADFVTAQILHQILQAQISLSLSAAVLPKISSTIIIP